MRRLARVWMLGTIVLIGACRSNDRADLVEAELRTRERQIRELQDELERERALNSAYDRSVRVPGMEPPAEPSASPGMPIKEVTIARGTGGLDEDGVTGDEGLLIVVVPRDEDRSAIKLPGSLSVSVYEVTPDGLKMPFTTWEVAANALRGTWQSGLFGSGYHVRLKWRNMPTYEKLRVVVQFRTLDGRVLEADKDVSVRLVRAPMPMMAPSGTIVPIAPMMQPLPQPIATPEPQIAPLPLPAPATNPIPVPVPVPLPVPVPAKGPLPVAPTSSVPFPQPDLGPLGPPQSAVQDEPSLLPAPRPSTSNRTSFPVQLMHPVPYIHINGPE